MAEPADLADQDAARLEECRAAVRRLRPDLNTRAVEERARRALRLMAYAGDPSRWTSPAPVRAPHVQGGKEVTPMPWTTGHTPTCGRPCGECGDPCDRSPEHPGADHLCNAHAPH